jgi:hypothetical protein
MGKQKFSLLRRYVDYIADLSVTWLKIESPPLKELLHAPTVRHWIGQRMIGDRGGHGGCGPLGNFLRKFSAIVD